MVPRIRGQLATIDEPGTKDDGKWIYLVKVTEIGKEDKPIFENVLGPFDTEKEAGDRGREICKIITQTIEKRLTGNISGNYIDMKLNQSVPWEKH